MKFKLNNINYKETKTVLGEGTFGEVILYAANNKSKIAVKEQLSNTKKRERRVAKEFNIQNGLSKLHGNHHIIKMLGQKTRGDYTFFAMEYASGGTIHNMTIDKKASLRMIKYYFKMLLAGVKFLHENGIVHRDIKPVNLILGERGLLKIADFGKAEYFIINGEEITIDGIIGTPRFAAPELKKGKQVEARPVDIFACGVTLLQMAANSDASWDDCEDEMYGRWERRETTSDDLWKIVHSSIMPILRMMIQTDVGQRATIEQMEDSKWFKDGRHNLRVAPKRKEVFENGNDENQPVKRKMSPATDPNPSKRSK